jgi:hypothetical protein
MQAINWWAILIATVSNFIVGGMWYSPALFIKSWLEMSEVSKSTFDAGLPKALVGDFFTSIALALGLSQVLRLSDAVDLGHGLFVTLWLWLAFVVPILIGSVTLRAQATSIFCDQRGLSLGEHGGHGRGSHALEIG